MRKHAADTASQDRRGRIESLPRLHPALLVGGLTLLFLAMFLLPDLIAPSHAKALDIPNPLDVADDAIDALNPANMAEDALKKAGTEAAGAIQDAFFWMLNQIFGGIQATLSVKLLTWLTTLPDFSGGQVAKIAKSMQIAAGAFLGCILTISIIRFWLGSYTSSGNASSGFEGLIRTGFAALLIGLWPRLFTMGVELANAFSAALLNDAAKQRLENLFQGLDMASLGLPIAGGATAGAVGLFVGAGISILVWIVIATASAVLFLGLIIMKIIVTAGTVIAFVAMPLALVLWPIPETSWIANMLAKAIAVLLAIPVLWILVFSAASAIGSDVFFLSNNGKNPDFLQTGLNILLIKPLVACALLYLAVMLPSRLVRMVPLAGGAKVPGSGTARAVTSYATYRSLDAVAGNSALRAPANAARQGVMDGFGSTGQGASGEPELTGVSAKAFGAGQKMGGQARQVFDRGKQMVGQQGGQAAGAAAGGSVAGPTGAAVGGAAGGAVGEKAASAVPSAGQQGGPVPRKDIAISDFENAPSNRKNANGGPLAMGSTPEREVRVSAEHNRMNSMSPEDRPTQAQTQDAWNKLGASPQAQQAIRNVSSAPESQGSTPKELAEWSVDTKNSGWGTQAEDATRTIGEASPQVRESVITGGQGYGGGGNTQTPRPAPAQANGNGNGNGGGTPRPGSGTKAVPDPTEGHKRPASKRGES